ncbi:MAG: formate dehydrogenase subunit alpha [Hydrogenobacter sp.]|uniref:formate dehydrogenase subunit alpha n=1 Tax=Hydrogenobacter thermophilus TaxID=940 RepID=UPI0030FC5F80
MAFVDVAIKDLGTPPSNSSKMVTLEIDGIRVSVPEGTSVLRAASVAGIRIPKLCATDTLKAFGSCRLCIVEIEGRKGYPASCTTLVEEGMKVRTHSEKLEKLRRGIMELYISDHPLDCLTCPANGNCELQDMAGYVGLREVRYGFDGKNHLNLPKDESNPYFTFDPSKCIVCYRCVRACDEIQNTIALTVEGRGFASLVKPGPTGKFATSECVSCGACVLACPTSALMEKSVIEQGIPDRSVRTTCAFCGVGCSFNAEVKGNKVVRMTPNKEGGANHGHSCVKGRFAWVYVYSEDRVTKPMIRKSIDEPWKEVSWEEAINYVAKEFKRIQEKYGKYAIGAITSSRCTNEEVYIIQKLVRAVFGNNNVDTCARVCHSPTGYGLKAAFGTSAGTNNFDSVRWADVIMIVGANPTEGHPVFGSLLKRRLREGARLIVIDPRKIELVETPHIRADYHLQLRPGTNVAILNAMAHTIVSEGLENKEFIEQRCDIEAYKKWREFILRPENSPEAVESITGVPARLIRGAARLYATGGRSAIYYGLGVTEHTQGTTAVLALANLAMLTGNIGKEGTGVNPLRGQNNVQGSCDMGSFPHELSGYRHVSDPEVRKLFEDVWGVKLDPEPGLRIPNMWMLALEGKFKGIYIQGEDVLQSDPDVNRVIQALKSMECVVVHDIFMNETAKYAHVFLPGCSFLEKDGTFTNAERRIQLVRQVIPPMCGKQEWEVVMDIANAMGYPMRYSHASEIMDEIARLTPSFAGVSYEKLERLGSIQWPCNEKAPEGTPIMHKDGFVRGKGMFHITAFVPSPERTTERYPLLLTTGRTLFQYNVGTQTRRTPNIFWYKEDVLEIHPHDAQQRGIKDGDYVKLESRKGWVILKAKISDRVAPGVVYTTFHFPEINTNVVTTDYSDWATNCPEYKVTAVQVTPVYQKPQLIGKYTQKELAGTEV